MLLWAVIGYAQTEQRKDNTPVTYEELYDEPSNIKKLFVHFQPLYGEMFATNINAGFGLEANYFLNEKFDFKGHFRKTYTSSFYDFARTQAEQNSDVDNTPVVFTYFELGGTYHVKDFETSSKTKMFLYKKSYAGNKWAARVPLSAEVPCQVRKIYGARLGAIVWKSATDINRVMEKQDLTTVDFVSSEGTTLADAESDPDNFKTDNSTIFSNVSSVGVYLGGSMTWIRNVSVSFDKFESGVDDLILTTYVDLIFAPSLKVDDIIYSKADPSGSRFDTNTYSASAISLSKFGFRAGIEGKFNRTLGWAYGAEIGMRPSIQGKMTYALLKISFPVFGTNVNYKVESFGK
jgi:hypothetical protein